MPFVCHSYIWSLVPGITSFHRLPPPPPPPRPPPPPPPPRLAEPRELAARALLPPPPPPLLNALPDEPRLAPDDARLVLGELRCDVEGDVEGLDPAPAPAPPGERLAPALAVEGRVPALAPAPACR